MSKFLTAPISQKTMPSGIPFIISNELAERFSFYGMKGILVTFMATYLWLMNSDPNAMPMSEAKICAASTLALVFSFTCEEAG